MKKILFVVLMSVFMFSGIGYTGQRNHSDSHNSYHSYNHGGHSYHNNYHHNNYHGHSYHSQYYQDLAIVVGVPILGAVIANTMSRPSGYYETRRVWVEPMWNIIYVPGYYDRGRYMAPYEKRVLVREGYYYETQIWTNR